MSGSDGPIPELCHEMDSLGPAVSKLQGKTERRLPPCLSSGTLLLSVRALSTLRASILVALVRSPSITRLLYLHRLDRLARGFTAPNIPRASDTLGPAMIHLWRGYRTARYSLPSFLILSPPRPSLLSGWPLPSAFYLLRRLNFFSPFLFLPLYFLSSFFSPFFSSSSLSLHRFVLLHFSAARIV